jgi:hypothetical protein
MIKIKNADTFLFIENAMSSLLQMLRQLVGEPRG